MKLLLASAALSTVLAFSGEAFAADVFAGDGRVFSGVATDNGEGLILPQSLAAGGIANYAATFDTGLGGQAAMVATVVGGPLAEGLAAFPSAPVTGVDFETRLTVGDIGWGLTPYLGMGVSQTSSSSRIFQGIPTLLPFETETIGMQGVAGIAYQLMPGVGAGVEYRYQGYSASTPVARDAADNQTIMMRLDLGLN
jgi:opacity protein-like surface antigen